MNEMIQQFLSTEVLAKILSQAVAFYLFYLILKKYAWGPVIGMVDERNRKIEESFRRAEDAEKKAEENRREYEERVKKIEAEAREKINEAINEGRRLAEEMTESAHAEAQRIQARAKELAEIEVAKARIELKEIIVRLTLDASERMLRERLDQDAHRRLVGEFVEELSRVE